MRGFDIRKDGWTDRVTKGGEYVSFSVQLKTSNCFFFFFNWIILLIGPGRKGAPFLAQKLYNFM